MIKLALFLGSWTMKLVLTFVALLTTCDSLASDDKIPQLADAIALTLDNGTIIDVGNHGFAAPEYRDMDGDGVPDLLVGEFEGGRLHVFHNYGTTTEQVFRESRLMMDINDKPLATDPG
jgi:hypothetical protein